MNIYSIGVDIMEITTMRVSKLTKQKFNKKKPYKTMSDEEFLLELLKK